MEVGQENKIKKREADLAIIEQALKTSKSSIRKAVLEVESFFMCENDKKAAKIKLKVLPLSFSSTPSSSSLHISIHSSPLILCFFCFIT